MTEQKAIEILRLHQQGEYDGDPQDLHDALEMAINSLSPLQSPLQRRKERRGEERIREDRIGEIVTSSYKRE